MFVQLRGCLSNEFVSRVLQNTDSVKIEKKTVKIFENVAFSGSYFLARLHEVHRAIVITSVVPVYVYLYVRIRVTLSVKVFRIKYKKFDPLEAVKTFKGRKYGLYCAISGNEPSSVALLNPATKARLLYCNFKKKSISLEHVDVSS